MRAVALVVILAACGKAPANPDARPDVSPYPLIDGPYDSCDPVFQVGCNPGEKCGWTRLAASPTTQHGLIECAPPGTAAIGALCAYGAVGVTSGYDDCQKGLVCVAPLDRDMAMGACEAVCDVTSAAGAPGSCDAGFTCTQHTGYFVNVGDPPLNAGLCDPM